MATVNPRMIRKPDHIYLVEGVYSVKMTATAGGNTDTQTCQLVVSRNYAHILEAREEPPRILAGITQLYDLNSVPVDQCVRLMELYFAAEKTEPAIGAGQKVAAAVHHAESFGCVYFAGDLSKC